MAKAWAWERKDRGGYWAQWMENGKRRTHRFDFKANRDRFVRKKIVDLENAYIDGVLCVGWDELRDRYWKLDASRLSSGSQKLIARALDVLAQVSSKAFSTCQWEGHLAQYGMTRLEGFTLKCAEGDKIVSSVTENTVGKEIRHLRAFFRFALNHHYISAMPVFPRIRGKSRQPQAFTKEEFQKIISHTKHPQWKMVILLAVATGRRISDLKALKTTDYRAENDTLCFGDIKSDSEGDWIPLNSKVAAELKTYIKDHVKKHTHLFTLGFQNAQWKMILKRAGVRPLRFHDLRSTFETWLMEAGFARAVAADIAGHTESVSAKHYGPVRQMRAKAIQAVDIPVQ